jgi:hypothetical protein
LPIRAVRALEEEFEPVDLVDLLADLSEAERAHERPATARCSG